MSNDASGPLKGVRVLDLSSVVAGPFCAGLLADLGAEVVKVEMPKIGDALRALAPHKNGVGLWSKVTNRNKRAITLDLRKPEAKPIVAKLVAKTDVVVENFRPGTLDGWGLSGAWMRDINPRLTILRMTGFGQSGPYRDRPGFARVFESMSGFTHICGEKDGPPMHLGFPISDSVGGLFGALGVVAALYDLKNRPDATGQEIDCSITEAMLRVLEFLPIEYDQLGICRGRSGNENQYAAPGGVFRTRDGQWASIAASTQSIFERFCVALGQPGLKDDPRFRTNPDRVRNRAVINGIVEEAIGRMTMAELQEALERHEVGFSPIYDAKALFADPHFAAREAIIPVADEELGEVRMQSVVPRFSATPGRVRHAGPSLGRDNLDVYRGLGLSDAEIAALREKEVI